MGPVKRSKQVITQPFKLGIHNGVDLRTMDFLSWKKQLIVATEEMLLLRFGIDKLGNDFFVLRPLRNQCFDEVKYIHVKPRNGFIEREILEEGAVLGYSAIRSDYKPPRSNSDAHHLHFEVWREGVPINPIAYFDVLKIPYEYKR